MISERQVLGSERLELMSPALPPMGTQGIDRWHYCDHHQGPCVGSVLFITLPVCSRGVLRFDRCLFLEISGKWGCGCEVGQWNMLEHVGTCWNMLEHVPYV